MPTLVTIQDRFTLAVGGAPMVGSFTVSNPDFTDVNGQFHPAAEETVYVASNGNFTCHLAPNQGASPAQTYYSVVYRLRNGQTTNEADYWIVPNSTATLNLEQVRVNKSVPPLPFQVQVGQLFQSNANVGDVVCFNGTSWVSTTVQSVFPFTFTNQTTFVIPAGSHGQGSVLLVQTYDVQGNELEPELNVAPGNGSVTVTFGSSTSGFGFIYGGLGRTLPNFSQFFAGATTVSIPVSSHHFNSQNLIVSCYDSFGNLIDGDATVNVSDDYTVTIAFGQPTNFLAVVVGCLGVSSVTTGSGNGSGSGSNGIALAASGSFVPGAVQDGDIVSPGTIAVPGATVGLPVIVGTTPALPVGVQAFGQVTSANAVTVSVLNLSGADLTIGATTFKVNVITQVVLAGNGSGGISVPAAGIVKSDGAELLPATTGVDYQAPLSFPLSVNQGGTGTNSPGLVGGTGIQITGSWPNQTIVSTVSGGSGPAAPYIQAVTAANFANISAVTHGKGQYALAFAFSNDVPSIASVPNYTRDSSGNLIFSFAQPWTGILQIQ